MNYSSMTTRATKENHSESLETGDARPESLESTKNTPGPQCRGRDGRTGDYLG